MTTVYHGSREYAAIDPAEGGRDGTTKRSVKYFSLHSLDDRSQTGQLVDVLVTPLVVAPVSKIFRSRSGQRI
jgi:hypothetical protein